MGLYLQEGMDSNEASANKNKRVYFKTGGVSMGMGSVLMMNGNHLTDSGIQTKQTNEYPASLHDGKIEVVKGPDKMIVQCDARAGAVFGGRFEWKAAYETADGAPIMALKKEMNSGTKDDGKIDSTREVYTWHTIVDGAAKMWLASNKKSKHLFKNWIDQVMERNTLDNVGYLNKALVENDKKIYAANRYAAKCTRGMELNALSFIHLNYDLYKLVDDVYDASKHGKIRINFGQRDCILANHKGAKFEDSTWARQNDSDGRKLLATVGLYKFS